MNIRKIALQALSYDDPDQKCDQVIQLWQHRDPQKVDSDLVLEASSPLPGRPLRPLLVKPSQVPIRSVQTLEGRAALVHALCHIEFNAINLALDAVWRFSHMPVHFYIDWLQIAYEEAQHFQMLRNILQQLPRSSHFYDYGDFEAHDGLWQMCEKTAHDVTARMALVPRTLEARGLDATPAIQAKLKNSQAPDAQVILKALDVIMRDEIGHVAIGNQWYHWCCQQQGLDPLTHMNHLAQHYKAPALRPPFNIEARKKAGFSETELQYLGILPLITHEDDAGHAIASSAHGPHEYK